MYFVRTSDARNIEVHRESSAFVMLCVSEDDRPSGSSSLGGSGAFAQVTYLGAEPEPIMPSRGTAPVSAAASRGTSGTSRSSDRHDHYNAAAAASSAPAHAGKHSHGTSKAVEWSDDDFVRVSKDGLPSDNRGGGGSRKEASKGGLFSGLMGWGSKSKPKQEAKTTSSARHGGGSKPAAHSRGGGKHATPALTDGTASGGHPPDYSSVAAGRAPSGSHPAASGGKSAYPATAPSYDAAIYGPTSSARHREASRERAIVHAPPTNVKLALFYVKPLVGDQVLTTPLNVDADTLREIDESLLGRGIGEGVEIDFILKSDALEYIQRRSGYLHPPPPVHTRTPHCLCTCALCCLRVHIEAHRRKCSS